MNHVHRVLQYLSYYVNLWVNLYHLVTVAFLEEFSVPYYIENRFSNFQDLASVLRPATVDRLQQSSNMGIIII